MNINFRSPRYVLPLIAFPFLCLFFYIYKSTAAEDKSPKAGQERLQKTISSTSGEVTARSLIDKLEAYRKQYRKGNGYTPTSQSPEESLDTSDFQTLYNVKEKRLLDSIEKTLMEARDPAGSNDHLDETADRALAEALAALQQQPTQSSPSPREEDPMELFRQQMALVDSMSKANDPEYRARVLAKKEEEAASRAMERVPKLNVSKKSQSSLAFNTVLPEREETLIKAIVDESITGYSGSRLRIRLLDDMVVGKYLVRKGTYLYAEISGFTGQRVRLTITSIAYKGKILPVRLEIYDNDGLPGLYVPASAFREFSRELGGDASRGMRLQGQAENNRALVMSALQRMFQSTTTAIARQIRKNKAKIKYNTLVYLIDPQQLEKSQHAY